MWLGKSVLSRARTSQKKQLESLSVSSMTSQKKSTHNYCLYCTNVNDQKYFLPKICGRLFISLTYQTNFTQTFILQLKRNHNNPNNQNTKNQNPKKDESLMITFLSHFTNKLQTKYTKPSTLTKTQRHIIESGKHIQTTQPVI